YKGTTLSIKVPEGPKCPLCSAKTSQRKGSSGIFWACTRYPECKGTVNIEQKKKKATSKSAKPRSSVARSS
ncbi:topoisomerase DNA-binding C4 zinc finger domain-containing protein, partial [Pseudomonas viridiflava]